MVATYYAPARRYVPVRLQFYSDSPVLTYFLDHTNFLDQVELLDAHGQVVPGAVGDPSFEQHRVYGSYEYRVSDPATPWVFGNHGGIAANDGPFNVQGAPGGQAGLVQGEDGIGLYQDLTLARGTYQVRFLAQNRIGYPHQLLGCYINGQHVLTAEPPSGQFQQYTTPPFTV